MKRTVKNATFPAAGERKKLFWNNGENFFVFIIKDGNIYFRTSGLIVFFITSDGSE